MNEQLKRKIKSEFEGQTPDLKKKIIEACKNETQEFSSNERVRTTSFWQWFVASAVCLALFFAGFFVGALSGSEENAYAQTSVYLDVNPSLLITLDADEKVLACYGQNEDGKKVLGQMDLRGVELKTAINAIIGAMYVDGYLVEEENAILISVDGSSNADRFLANITSDVNEVFVNSQMRCSIIAQDVHADESLTKRANEHGISVGKMHLIDKMLEGYEQFDEMSVEELSQMSICQLNHIYVNNHVPGGKGEVITGDVNGFISKEDALIKVIEYLNISESEVERSDVIVLPIKHNNSRMAYAVRIKIKGENKEYKYDVDCISGEVFEFDHGQNTPPHEQDAPPGQNAPLPSKKDL